MNQPPKKVGNRFLLALPHDLSDRIINSLEQIPLPRGMVLAHAGAFADTVYFPDRGLVSLLKVMEDGRTAEVGYVGVEGIAGGPALFGLEQAPFEAIIQVEGEGRAIKTAVLRAEMERSPVLKELVLRYVYFAFIKLGQTAACNRLHTLRQRCCRWLLTAGDNADATTFTLTHEFLALMMGVNRPALSLTLNALQRQRTIKYKRASITVANRRALEKGTCECYWTLKHACDRLYEL